MWVTSCPRRTDNVNAPGFDDDNRARNDPSNPRSSNSVSASTPLMDGWNHLQYSIEMWQKIGSFVCLCVIFKKSTKTNKIIGFWWKEQRNNTLDSARQIEIKSQGRLCMSDGKRMIQCLQGPLIHSAQTRLDCWSCWTWEHQMERYAFSFANPIGTHTLTHIIHTNAYPCTRLCASQTFTTIVTGCLPVRIAFSHNI